jgi:hypothetical protein
MLVGPSSGVNQAQVATVLFVPGQDLGTPREIAGIMSDEGI